MHGSGPTMCSITLFLAYQASEQVSPAEHEMVSILCSRAERQRALKAYQISAMLWTIRQM